MHPVEHLSDFLRLDPIPEPTPGEVKCYLEGIAKELLVDEKNRVERILAALSKLP